MSDKPFNEQAAFLIETSVDLIKQVLTKHSAAVLEEMHDQIVARNQRIKQLEDELEFDKTEKSKGLISFTCALICKGFSIAHNVVDLRDET